MTYRKFCSIFFPLPKDALFFLISAGAWKCWFCKETITQVGYFKKIIVIRAWICVYFLIWSQEMFCWFCYTTFCGIRNSNGKVILFITIKELLHITICVHIFYVYFTNVELIQTELNIHAIDIYFGLFSNETHVHIYNSFTLRFYDYKTYRN